MLTQTNIFKRYASIEDYNEFVNQTIQELQYNFPQVRLKSFSSFKNFLDELLPKLVHKYLIGSGTMKNCSGISPDFSEIACQAGFPVLTQHVPGHQRNIVITNDGPFIIDLSYIQFTCKYDLSDKTSRKEVIENYKSLYKDPWKAIKIKQLPKEVMGGIDLPTGQYDNTNPDPMKIITDYDIKETEEAFPERFDRFKI